MIRLSDGIPARRFPYPRSRVLTLLLVFPVQIPVFIYLGLWFLYQFVEASHGLFSASAHGGGTAFFSDVGGFVFGFVVASRAPAKRPEQSRTPLGCVSNIESSHSVPKITGPSCEIARIPSSIEKP
jgi:hypothetical protein